MEVNGDYRKYVFYTAVIILLYLFYRVIEPYITYLALGILLAILIYPVNKAINARLKNDKLSAGITTTLALLIIVIPTLLMISSLVGEMISFFSNVNLSFISELSNYIAKASGQDTYILENLSSMITSGAQYLLSSAPNIIGSFADVIIGLLMLFSITYYVLVESDLWIERLKLLMPLNDSQRERFYHIVKRIIYSTLYGEIVIAVIQGILGGILFYLLGIPNPIMWGFIMGILAFLPFVGTGIIWAPVVIMRFLNGEVIASFIILAYGVALMTGIDYILRPKIIARASRVHPLTAILGAFGGIHFFGFTGLILGPMIAALFEAMITFYYDEQKAKAETGHKVKRKSQAK